MAIIANRLHLVLAVLATAVLVSGGPAFADEPAASPDEPTESAEAQPVSENPSDAGPPDRISPEIFERVKVVGSPDRASRAPGSVTYIDRAALERQQHTDVLRVLRLVPGINIQEEDGFGLRPNIGMRGSGSERSSKITLMEDGVLIAPAPYSAPAAYYFPTMGRMEALEVRKGSASVRQGPFTTGGVLNLVSTSIPADFGGSVDVALGNHDTARGRLHIGDSGPRLGWLFETFQMESAGFKQLDTGGDTGFDLADYTGKLRFTSAPGAARFQALELKVGKTDQSGQETYLGLTQEDFERDPFRRYAASQLDELSTEHEQVQARYFLKPGERVDLTATVYRNDFFRNWRKLESVNGAGIAEILADPGAHAAEMAIIRADLTQDSPDDALVVRNNRRDYYGRGVQVLLGLDPGARGAGHELELGLRYHEDEEDRFQENDQFKMTAAADLVLTTAGAPGSQANRVSSARALALFAQDTIEVGRFTVVPGLRFESIDFERVDYADPARSIVAGRATHEVDELIPGVGVDLLVGPGSHAFVGVHRGFAPPSPGQREADAEESVNYEAGYRFSRNAIHAEAIGFLNDYANLLGTCTESAGCSSADVGDQFNGGEARTWGLEARATWDLTLGSAAARFPLQVSYTLTRTEFLNSFESDYEPWGDVVAGDEFPYVPRQQVGIGLGFVDRTLSLQADVVYFDAMRTEAGQGPMPPGQATDSAVLLDLTAAYAIRPGLRLYAQGRNLTDQTYVAARQPAGARPGLDRAVLAGVRFDF